MDKKVSFTAMKNGVIPVYLKINDEVNIGITDNKYEWHLKVNTPDELYKKIINTFNKYFYSGLQYINIFFS